MGKMKAKPKYQYTMPDNIRFIFANMWGWDKPLTVMSLLRAPFTVAVPLLGIYLSRTVVSMVGAQATPNELVSAIIIICCATAVCMVMRTIMSAQNLRMEFVLGFKYQSTIIEKLLTHDYEYNESQEGLSSAEKALQYTGSDTSGARRAIDTLTSFAANIIGLVSYASMICLLHPVILLVICTTMAASYFVMKRTTAWNHRNKDNWIPYDRKIRYLRSNSSDFSTAKDIRLYNMADWFRELFAISLGKRREWQKKEETYGYGIDMLCVLLSFIREGISYGLLLYMMYQKGIPVADFIFYFGVIGGFTGWIDGIVNNFYWFDRIHVGCCEMRGYIDYKNKSNHGEGVSLPGETFSVEFKNVGYKFMDNEAEVIKNLSFKINKGEKLAIVGPNGAGKTTIVKLMCGLYSPTEGEILINGKPIDAYNIEDYFTLIAAVFQDIFIMPMSIRKNITCCQDDKTDADRFDNVIRLAGFDDKIAALTNGADTYLVKGLYPGAVDLSGGELQKLALARALYKDGKILVLDEPTAALDPIAESGIYQQYNEISQGKTSVFISHRLASTRFCDRIFYIENGEVIENGSHDELIRRKGKYYELFEIQSHYYREGVKAV